MSIIRLDQLPLRPHQSPHDSALTATLAAAANAAAANDFNRLVDEIGMVEWGALSPSDAALAAHWLIKGLHSSQNEPEKALLGARLAALLLENVDSAQIADGKVLAEARLEEARLLQSLNRFEERRQVLCELRAWLCIAQFAGAKALLEETEEQLRLHRSNSSRSHQLPLAHRLVSLRPVRK